MVDSPFVAARVLLLRHAQSEWNATGRWQGWADPALSAEGAEQAAAAAADPALDGITIAVASDLRRAHSTASLIAASRGWPEVRTFRGLRERGAGAWTGLTRDEILQRWPGALSGPRVDIPGGESDTAATARAVATLHRIVAEWPDAEVLAVCHGGIIRLVEQHLGATSSSVVNLAGRWVGMTNGSLELGPTASLSVIGSAA